jgi:predicted RND superfamily exporter protein
LNLKKILHIEKLRNLKKETKARLCFFALVLISLIIFSQTVDLTPEVGSDFFFSSDNPRFQYNKLISKIFPTKSSQLIVSAMGNIDSAEYITRVNVLTDVLSLMPGVGSVKSVTSGPKNVKDAMESPLWRRILISEDGLSTNIVAFLEDVSPQRIIPKFESAVALLRSDAFKLNIAGVPYVVEMIRRNLVHDLTVFSAVAFIAFGIMIILIFRSVVVFIGTMISCIEACILTLIITSISGIKTGVLTVNLSTIVFVLTLSHIIFLTHNWKALIETEKNKNTGQLIIPAMRLTFNASFWCMVTTLLGFLSLLFVQAKPLRELGISGSIGTVVAISAAYGIYPAFLMIIKPDLQKIRMQKQERARVFFLKRSFFFAGALIALTIICVPGLWKLNTDPPLFSYFSKGSDLRKGLEYIDQNGGSSPLDLVIRDSEGAKLNTNTAFKRMWELQDALEKDPNVGSVISLPVLMAEGIRAPLAFMLNWESLLMWMEKPQYHKIARSFITADHVSGHFLLRMKESAKKTSRIEVVDQIKKIVSANGFITEMVGGLYLLQGEMANLVASSLVYGLGRLVLFFFFIAFVVSRSFRISLAMVLGLGIVPLCVLGAIGYFRVPLDIISAPAVNVAIGMGIDSMIHTVSSVRRQQAKGIDANRAWLQARIRLWKPIFSSMLIISIGFGIFALSAFPPTQRFGISIVLGTLLAASSTIFVLPLLAKYRV